MAFTHNHRVRFHECDPAGIVYFATVLTLCHTAYEELLRQGGLPLEEVINGPVIYPLRHSEADYLSPLRLGAQVTLRLTVARLSERSFTLAFALSDEAGRPLAQVQTAHVAVDRTQMRPVALPEAVRALLLPHLEPAAG